MRGGDEVKSREDAEIKLRKMQHMKDSDKMVSLLEMMVDLLMDIRFGEKKKE